MKRRVMQEGIKADSNTLLLLHFDNNVKDSSKYSRSLVYQNINYITGVFSESCKLSSNGHVRVPPEVFNDRLNSDWTIDFWCKINSFSNNSPVLAAWGTPSVFAVMGTGPSTAWVLVVREGASVYTEICSFSITVGAWFHLAIVRKEGRIYVSKNGSVIGSVHIGNLRTTTANLYLNLKEDTNTYGDICIDEFRISDIARWTSNFTPPAKPY